MISSSSVNMLSLTPVNKIGSKIKFKLNQPTLRHLRPLFGKTWPILIQK